MLGTVRLVWKIFEIFNILKKTKILISKLNIIGGQKNYGSKSSGVKDNNGKSKTAKKQTPVYNEKAMLLSSDEELP